MSGDGPRQTLEDSAAGSLSSWDRAPAPERTLEDSALSLSDWSAPLHASDEGMPSPRYADQGFIGEGGMGEVIRVLDRHLGCALAMKVLSPRRAGSAQAHRRFLNEARLTARLRHPGVVAVQDHGTLPDGRPWFTMTEVQGASLSALLEDPDLPLRRLVGWLIRVCDVIAYAHSVGVIHRDLKPDNVMIGDFGEVYVMDWGLGRALDERLDAAQDAEEVEGLEPGLTRHGQVMGTPAYMPPEQAAGREVGPAADVYALGAMLFHGLVGRPPHAELPWRPVEPEALTGPEALRRLCAQALSVDPAARPESAQRLAQELRRWLDGAERRAQAEARMDEADALAPEVQRLRQQAARAMAEAEAGLAALPPWAPAEDREPHWARQAEAEARTLTAEVQEVQWLRTVRAALDLSPELPRATQALAEHYKERLLSAERAGDRRGAARYEALLRSWDRGRFAALLRGDGALTLITEPSGAEVRAARFERVGRRLVPGPERVLGHTPLKACPLPRGSYRLTLRAPGYAPLIYPALIERGGHWDGVAPGEQAPTALRLWPEGHLTEAEVRVPAGWFLSGGDPEADEPLPARRLWLDERVAQRHPVTVAQYLAFLDALAAEGRAAEALEHAPRRPEARGGAPLARPDAAGRFVLEPDTLELDHPVTGVSWYGACAYAAWWSARTGQPWRLPSELEWEKLARGVDGRFMPWGESPEPCWARMLGSSEGATSPAPVQAYPIDASVYGVRGLGGNVRDWCSNPWSHAGPPAPGGRVLPGVCDLEDPSLRVLRGGCWTTAPVHCRAAGRTVNAPGGRFVSLGFRLLRST
ncbi:MAG: SUMF1/EgtB/PvdO family nonheme iron enzyme [Alphaproteobacteria bacterium]|nr:SUMF1/EgtB/PvdO family nonheme iron enzyme [Alphaproteobacteria bacterium]